MVPKFDVENLVVLESKEVLKEKSHTMRGHVKRTQLKELPMAKARQFE